MTTAEMVELAEQFAGHLEEKYRALLPGLCRAAEAELKRRLRPDATGYEVPLGYAAAWLALDQLRYVTEEPMQFTAGDFSVSRRAGGALKAKALELLRPWLASEFVFKKV